MKLKRPLYGGEKGRDVRAVERALHKWSSGKSQKPDSVYDERDQWWVRKFQKEHDIRPITGDVGQATLNALWYYMDLFSRQLYRGFTLPKPAPELGPAVEGGVTILLHDCTHLTSTLNWPAFDDGWVAGRKVIAPEDCIVYDNTSGSAGGDAFYIEGLYTGMQYWVAHILHVPSLNRRYKKGEVMTTIANISAGHGGPHLHLAINARPLIGRHLESHDDYTHGAPLIGKQIGPALEKLAA